MKKVKLLLLIVLNITKTSVEEVIKVNDYITDTRTSTDIMKHYNMWYPTYVNYIPKGETIELEDFSQKADGIEYHQKDIKETNNGYNYTYNYTYPIKKYYDSYVLATTFIETTVHEGYNNLVIKTGKQNLLCQYDHFDSVKINITIDPEVYKLNYTNTKDINNNTYSWTLNRNNCNNSEIILTLDTITSNEDFIINNPTDNSNNINVKKNDYTMYVFCGILILLILIGYFIFQKIKEKNEKFNIDD